MRKTSFENLEVYRLAERLSDEVWKAVVKWKPFPKNTIGRQLVDAADSVAANIAEGSGRYNFKDNGRFIKIARGSLYETKSWLRRAFTRKLLTDRQIGRIKPLIEELLPKLNAYKRAIERLSKTNN